MGPERAAMVVVYPAASEGSWASFFIQTPQIVLHRQGSVIFHILPQVLFAVGISVISHQWNPVLIYGLDVQAGMRYLGLILSFLLVFKTQSAYLMYVSSITDAEKLVHFAAEILTAACSIFPADNWENHMASLVPPTVEGVRTGMLRIRVIAAHGLWNVDEVAGMDLHTVVSVGDQSFRTDAADSSTDPVWNSDVFEFPLEGAEQEQVRIAVQGHVELGSLILPNQVLSQGDQRWRRSRQRLDDGGGQGEIDLEVSFAPSALGPLACRDWSALVLDAEGCEALCEEERVVNFLVRGGLRRCAEKLRDAGFTSFDALERITDHEMRKAGLCLADIAVLRHRLRQRAAAVEEAAEAAEAAANSVCLRRTVHYLALFYFVAVENVRCTRHFAFLSPAAQDQLREDVKSLCCEDEYKILYPGDSKDVPGSKSKNAFTDPITVLHWVHLHVHTCAESHQLPIQFATAFIPKLCSLGGAFQGLQMTASFQFPLPYAQVIKLLSFFFVLLAPWVLEPFCKEMTSPIAALIALGVFGLDEVAEIIESPFGSDPNHISFFQYGQELLDRLELLYHSRERSSKYIDAVFTESDVRNSTTIFDFRNASPFNNEKKEPEAPHDFFTFLTRSRPLNKVTTTALELATIDWRKATNKKVAERKRRPSLFSDGSAASFVCSPREGLEIARSADCAYYRANVSDYQDIVTKRRPSLFSAAGSAASFVCSPSESDSIEGVASANLGLDSAESSKFKKARGKSEIGAERRKQLFSADDHAVPVPEPTDAAKEYSRAASVFQAEEEEVIWGVGVYRRADSKNAEPRGYRPPPGRGGAPARE